MVETEAKKCGHDPCNCTVMDDDNYCSQQCEATANVGIESIMCDCDHPGCNMKA